MDFSAAGNAIQQMRKERDLTQEQLAEMVGVNNNSISRIERGITVPSVPTLIQICNALQISADKVLSAYIDVDAEVQFSEIAKKMEGLDKEQREKVKDLLTFILNWM